MEKMHFIKRKEPEVYQVMSEQAFLEIPKKDKINIEKQVLLEITNEEKEKIFKQSREKVREDIKKRIEKYI